MKQLVTILFLAIAITAQAQRNFNIGIKAGVNLADFSDAASSSSRTALHAGAFLHLRLNPAWALQPEIVYSLQGAEFNADIYQVDYINIPIVLQFFFASSFRVQTGVQLGTLVSARYDPDIGDDENRKRFFRNSDLSLLFGGGFMLTNRIGMDARYLVGITEIHKEQNGYKNRVWQIGAYYLLFK